MFGLSSGLGNAYGGLGGALEVYGMKGRGSIRFGAGRLPGPEGGIPGWIAYSGGLRWYASVGRHGVAVDASYSMLYFETISQAGELVSRTHSYGLGLGAAYRFTGSRGLHLDAGLGSGWSAGRSEFRPTFSLGFGYTWYLRE